jgi:nitrate reductase gamma subunit
MLGPILIVVSYLLLATFLVAFVLRAVRIARLPVHLRWELAPVPHEKGKSQYGGSYFEEYEWWTKPRAKSIVNELSYMVQEIVLLKSVWEHNRRLWWFSFPFHFGMYLLITAALLLTLNAVLELVGSGWPALHTAALPLAAAGFALGIIGAIGLLVKRLTDPQLKPFTTPASLFNLALLLAVFASGGYALLTVGDFAAGSSGFVRALLTADMFVQTPAVLAVHFGLVGLFLAYLPFSQMMHFVAKYFTYHQVRWDDTPLSADSRMERKVLDLLGQPVTWSGSHLNTDGKKNWVDIATEVDAK